ncbi:hypothetical protein LPJ73_000159 [Coemansia sp. RSA 2703]|nr:hypothetical protein LPJ73_000159 [Coemansia sp. RSA 2703]KAJ2379289.1 hypothetical protein IW150_000273 [Coemansia sp. RSA 2607]KAJ2398357.1 hypothetical protein GGI05_000131 [Coemansia sp. RSA 2603]
MSSRAVKRLLKERGVDELAETASRLETAAAANKGNESDDSVEIKAPAKANMFDLLMGGGEDQSESEEEEKAENKIVSAQPVVTAAKAEASTRDTSKSKKNKKKKKGKAKHVDKSEEDAMSMAEFEAQLEAIKAQDKQAAKTNRSDKSGKDKGKTVASDFGLSDEQQRNRALLMADSKHLDSQAEIRRLFGSAATKSNSDQRGRGRGRAMLGSGLRRMALAQPKATWPPMRASPGVDMKQLGVDGETDKHTSQIIDKDKTGGVWFALEHSTRFRTIQIEFLSAVATHNPDAIAAIVYHHPYHVDALLQLSEILKQTGGDFGEAGELVERALYAFENGFAARFSPTNGMGRLDFRRVESRGLFLALFRHMQFMARRGCWRTAFEVNKVLLSLDPVQDPYGALLTLDFHALKSKQYDYICQFVDGWTWSSVELPNLVYSRALAEFMLESQAPKKASSSETRSQRSMDLLIDAILIFPTVIPPLMSKANIDVDPVVLTHPYFQDEHIPDTTELTHMQLLVQLFVERHSALYRTPEVSRWLQEGLLLALERVVLMEDSDGDVAVERRQAAKRRLCTYVVPENISRHVLVADMEAMKAGLPEDVRSAESFAFDPLPPRDNINVYEDVLGTGLGAGHMGMPGAFNFDDNVVDLEELRQDGPGYIAQMLEQLRRGLGIGPGDEPLDPGTSEDEYEYEDQAFEDFDDFEESETSDGVPE